jgi:hypothetical protein
LFQIREWHLNERINGTNRWHKRRQKWCAMGGKIDRGLEPRYQ